MNVTSIQLCSPKATGDPRIVHATLPLVGTNRTTPYVLKGATGLDLDEVVSTYDDGPLFFRMKPQDRVVSLKIGLNPNYEDGTTVGDLRDSLYKAISYNVPSIEYNTESKIELRFLNGETYLGSLFGIVRKLETDLFSADSSLIMMIKCDYPFICSTEATEATIGVDGGFSNFSVTDTRSTAPHGFKAIIECVTDVEDLVIRDSKNPTKYLFWVHWDFLDGDLVYLSSEEDDKYIYLERSGYPNRSLIDRIYWGSIWPYMYPGYNLFTLSASQQFNVVTFRDTYWGL